MRKQSLTTDQYGSLIFLLALFVGAWFRVFPPLDAGFPINDGGLFYVMIKTLQSNQYQLPNFVSYNGLQIPFVYPPFAFYLTGIVSDLLKVDLIEVMRWLPAFILIITIPIVYKFSYLLLGTSFTAGIATFLYAVMPRSIDWFIMGGGITRSLGQFFMLLALINVLNLYTTKRKKYIYFALVFCVLVVLTHPEATIHTIGLIIILWIFHGRNKVSILNSVIIGVGTSLLTSPWWARMLFTFGTGPFQSAAGTGFHNGQYIIAPFIPFTEESFIPLIAVLGIIGVAVSIAQNKLLIPVMIYIPFVIEPRNAPNVAIIPLAMMASIGLTTLVLPYLAKLEAQARNLTFTTPLQSRSEKFFCIFCAFALLLGVQLSGSTFSKNRVSPDMLNSFAWVRENTKRDDTFVLLTGAKSGLGDSANEWFPALTERESITTIQGKEWLGGNQFYESHTAASALQECIYSLDTFDCIHVTLKKIGREDTYIIFKIQPTILGNQFDPTTNKVNGYEVAYFSDQVIILKKQQAE